MLERMRIPYDPVEGIDIADRALIEGDLDFAESVLAEAIQTAYTENPDAYHHLALKAVSMPFYELVGTKPTMLEQKNAAQTVYDWVGHFIESELNSPDYYSPNREVRERRVGRLSENVVFSFLIRKYMRAGKKIPLPATHYEDKAHKIDFLLTPVHGLDETGKSIQAKTRSSRLIIDGVIYIGVNLLDPDFHRHDTEGSLARCIVREAAGTAGPDEIEKLHRADRHLDTLLA